MRAPSCLPGRPLLGAWVPLLVAAHRPQDLASMLEAGTAGSQAEILHIVQEGALTDDERRNVEAERYIVGNATKLLQNKERNGVWYCNDWCITCVERDIPLRSMEGGSNDMPASVTRQAAWKVKRGQDRLKLVAKAVFAVAAVAAVGALTAFTGGTALIGLGSVLTLKFGGLMLAGGIAGGMLAKDVITKPRDCPNVSFTQILKSNNDKNSIWNKFKSTDTEAEESLGLADLNLYEIMYNIQTKTDGNPQRIVPEISGERTREDWPVADYPPGAKDEVKMEARNTKRILMALSCNALMLDEKNWASMVSRNRTHMNAISTDSPEFGVDLMKHCGQWLCAGEVESVKRFKWHERTVCGDRWLDFTKKSDVAHASTKSKGFWR